MAEQDKLAVREFIDVIFNKHELDDAERFFTSDFVEHNAWPGFPATVQGFKDGSRAFFAGFPDAHCEVDEMLADGDKVIVRSRLIGTNTGAFMGMPATGKRVEVEGIDIVRIVDGRQAEHWGLFDGAGMMQQLGAMPAPAGAPS